MQSLREALESGICSARSRRKRVQTTLRALPRADDAVAREQQHVARELPGVHARAQVAHEAPECSVLRSAVVYSAVLSHFTVLYTYGNYRHLMVLTEQISSHVFSMHEQHSVSY